MENTLENKAKFIHQYYGQKLMYVGGVGLVKIGSGYNTKHPDFFLKLTPLNLISDEDLIKVAEIINMYGAMDILSNEAILKMHMSMAKKFLFGEYRCYRDVVIWFQICDFLRSKGYALSYNDLSVEEQVQHGWVVLK